MNQDTVNQILDKSKHRYEMVKLAYLCQVVSIMEFQQFIIQEQRIDAQTIQNEYGTKINNAINSREKF